MSAAQIITFGCRLNSFEAEVMRGHAAGLEDMVIVNTCAVTAEAERQARQAIRKARRERPGARIIVTGCAAQIAPEKFAAMPEVDQVLGNEEKLRAESFQAQPPEKIRVGDIMTVRQTAGHLIDGFEGRARAFVQVQTGCDHRCTFCIIPFGRGNSRSVPLGALVDQARRLVAAGYREIVLTGVDISSFGADLPGRPSLGALCRRLLAAVPDLARLRLSSLDPATFDDELAALIAGEPRLMPHVHLSLQAGDDMILKRMKRRHSRDQAVELCRRLRALRPDVALGADLIAGFPTETEAMFENTLRLIDDCGLTFLHVFPFSPRAGTPAAKMPPLDKAVRVERAARLRAAGAKALDRWLAGRLGATAAVLVERREGKDMIGHSEHFAPVRLAGEHMPGSLVSARITGVADQTLMGEAA
jgi:threonylcarbamoyladenosine tRNA methylthiotransferase MtaB